MQTMRLGLVVTVSMVCVVGCKKKEEPAAAAPAPVAAAPATGGEAKAPPAATGKGCPAGYTAVAVANTKDYKACVKMPEGCKVDGSDVNCDIGGGDQDRVQFSTEDTYEACMKRWGDAAHDATHSELKEGDMPSKKGHWFDVKNKSYPNRDAYACFQSPKGVQEAAGCSVQKSNSDKVLTVCRDVIAVAAE